MCGFVQKLCRCDRTSEIEDALNFFSPFVACKQGRIVAYTCAVSALSHSVAQTEADMQALLLGAAAYSSRRIAFFSLAAEVCKFVSLVLARGAARAQADGGDGSWRVSVAGGMLVSVFCLLSTKTVRTLLIAEIIARIAFSFFLLPSSF
jgi:hypothetical protein